MRSKSYAKERYWHYCTKKLRPPPSPQYYFVYIFYISNPLFVVNVNLSVWRRKRHNASFGLEYFCVTFAHPVVVEDLNVARIVFYMYVYIFLPCTIPGSQGSKGWKERKMAGLSFFSDVTDFSTHFKAVEVFRSDQFFTWESRVTNRDFNIKRSEFSENLLDFGQWEEIICWKRRLKFWDLLTLVQYLKFQFFYKLAYFANTQWFGKFSTLFYII